jgi:translocator assembly and maintenance protein 41
MQVESPHEWHRQNIAAHPSHYSFLRWLGANTVGQVQEKLGSGVYYNTLVTWDDRRIKYGVVSAARLRGDLRDWSDLYLAGRLHKPVITLKDDAEISVAKEANLGAALVPTDPVGRVTAESANADSGAENGVRTALLMLPEEFSEKQLFRTVAGLSYLGDWRMQAGENPDKVKNIVDSNMVCHKIP